MKTMAQQLNASSPYETLLAAARKPISDRYQRITRRAQLPGTWRVHLGVGVGNPGRGFSGKPFRFLWKGALRDLPVKRGMLGGVWKEYIGRCACWERLGGRFG